MTLSVVDADSTAAGIDYTAFTADTITIAAGHTGMTTLNITPTNNTIAATDKTIIFDGEASGAVMIAAAMITEATLRIIDDDSADICERTAAVYNEILARIPGVTDCAAVTPAQLATITFLHFGNQGITTLKAGDFAGLSALTFLDLSSNPLTTLSAGIFSDLSKLTTLDLSDNLLTTLPAGIFSGLSKLTRLDLSSSRLTTLFAALFADVPLAATISLDSRVTVIPVAEAGMAETVTSGEVVTLQGSAIVHRRDATPTYAWTQMGTPMVTLSSEATAMPTFTAPIVMAPTDLTFRLTATLISSVAIATSPAATVTITVNPAHGGRHRLTHQLTITESTTGTYTLVLTTVPNANVIITPSSSSNTVATVTPAALTFTTTNWQMAQTVTVTAVDNNATGVGSAIISHMITGGDYANVTADDVTLTITDDDTPTTLMLSVTPMMISEDGGTQAVTISAAFPAGSAPLSTATTLTLSVTGTAISDTDYATFTAGTITIAAGEPLA